MEKMVLSKFLPLITKVCLTDSSHIIDDRGEPPIWPLNVVETEWHLGKFYPKELYESLKTLKNKGYDWQKLAEVFRFPTRLTDLFHFIEIPLKGLNVSQKEELFSDCVKIAGYLRKDPFCLKGRNEIISKKQIAGLLKSGRWLKKESKNNKLFDILGRLHALMFLYCEFIWVGGRHQLSHEIHGPYDLGDNSLLLVREYYDLKPEVWPFCMSVPMESFTLLEVYEPVSIKIDCYNHIEFSEPLIKKLKSFSLVGNSPNRILTIYGGINKALAQGNKYVGDFAKSDWLKKAVEMQAWSIKPFKDLLGEDWRSKSKFLQNLDTSESELYVKNLFQEIGPIMEVKNKTQRLKKLTDYFVQRFYSQPT